MYKGFFEDVEYVMGLFFKPLEGCCRKDDEDDDKEEKCAMGCDGAPCCKESEDEEEKEEKCAMGCDSKPCGKESGDKEDGSEDGGLLSKGPVQDILKCLFDASDIDYDYED